MRIDTKNMEIKSPKIAKNKEIGDSLIKTSKFVFKPPSKSIIRMAIEAK